MKHIIKKPPPKSLEAYKLTEGACYDNLPKDVKDDLRDSLVDEQGGICCYCGKRIHADYRSVIEHFLPKGLEKYSHLQLEYSNLLCSCDGGESDRKGKSKPEKRKFPQFCDDKKNDQILNLSPLDPSCEGQFKYDDEGHIYGKTKAAIDAINILGLDCAPLNKLREAAIKPYVNMDIEADEWTAVIEDLSSRHKNEFLPFCVAAIYYIKEFKLIV